MYKLLNKQKLIDSSHDNCYFLAIKQCKISNTYSIFKGDGINFNVLRGTHHIKKMDDGYYNFYNEQPKKIGDLEDSILIKEKELWSMSDFEDIPEFLLKELKLKYHEDSEKIFTSNIKRHSDCICFLFEEIIKRGAFKKKYLKL